MPAKEKLLTIVRTKSPKAKEYLEKNPPQKELSATRLGRLRIEIKKHLAKEMQAIDKLVERVIR
jgi:hypothetical protein